MEKAKKLVVTYEKDKTKIIDNWEEAVENFRAACKHVGKAFTNLGAAFEELQNMDKSEFKKLKEYLDDKLS